MFNKQLYTIYLEGLEVHDQHQVPRLQRLLRTQYNIQLNFFIRSGDELVGVCKCKNNLGIQTQRDITKQANEYFIGGLL